MVSWAPTTISFKYLIINILALRKFFPVAGLFCNIWIILCHVGSFKKHIGVYLPTPQQKLLPFENEFLRKKP